MSSVIVTALYALSPLSAEPEYNALETDNNRHLRINTGQKQLLKQGNHSSLVQFSIRPIIYTQMIAPLMQSEDIIGK